MASPTRRPYLHNLDSDEKQTTLWQLISNPRVASIPPGFEAVDRRSRQDPNSNRPKFDGTMQPPPSTNRGPLTTCTTFSKTVSNPCNLEISRNSKARCNLRPHRIGEIDDLYYISEKSVKPCNSELSGNPAVRCKRPHGSTPGRARPAEPGALESPAASSRAEAPASPHEIQMGRVDTMQQPRS